MKSIVAIAAASLIAAVSPAAAEPLAPKPVAEAAAQEGVPAPKAQRQRVCVVDTITGSRLPVKQCHTREEWRARGVDLPAGI